MGRRLGLIVGINSYQDTAFRPLQFAETDAKAIAQWLVNTKGGNWSPADVQLVQGAVATRELIETLTTQMCVNIAGPDDIVCIYFAGHAFVDGTTGEGYLALANTNYRQPSTGLHLRSLAQQAMGNSHASHVVFILDCFQTGPAWNRQRSSPFDSRPLLGSTLLQAVQQANNRLILCSCRGNEYAEEAGEKNLGLLTYRTIVGLSGPAINPETHTTTLQKLYTYLFNVLGEQQRPQLFGQEQTPLILVGDLPTTPATLTTPPSSGGISGSLPNSSSIQPFTSNATMASTPQNAAVATATMQSFPSTSGIQLPPLDQQQHLQLQQQTAMLLRQAHHLIQMQNPGEAFNVVERLLQLEPSNVNALILKGQLLGTVGRFPEAMSAVQSVLRLDPNNALAWSMQAALLTNMGQYQDALQAVEHSLELDPNNPETYSIKTRITGHMAAMQSKAFNTRERTSGLSQQKEKNTTAFFIGAGLQLLGLLIGIAGAVLPIFQPNLPVALPFLLEGLGLALLCVYGARGAYLYGFPSFILTVFFSIIPAAILGGTYKLGLTRIMQSIADHPPLIIPFLFLGAWLAVGAAIPLVLAIFGLIAGLIVGVRRKKT